MNCQTADFGVVSDQQSPFMIVGNAVGVSTCRNSRSQKQAADAIAYAAISAARCNMREMFAGAGIKQTRPESAWRQEVSGRVSLKVTAFTGALQAVRSDLLPRRRELGTFRA